MAYFYLLIIVDVHFIKCLWSKGYVYKTNNKLINVS